MIKTYPNIEGSLVSLYYIDLNHFFLTQMVLPSTSEALWFADNTLPLQLNSNSVWFIPNCRPKASIPFSITTSGLMDTLNTLALLLLHKLSWHLMVNNTLEWLNFPISSVWNVSDCSDLPEAKELLICAASLAQVSLTRTDGKAGTTVGIKLGSSFTLLAFLAQFGPDLHFKLLGDIAERLLILR